MPWLYSILLSLLILFLSSCANPPLHPPKEQLLAYTIPDEEYLLSRLAPVFVIEEPEFPHNHIGTPVVDRKEDGSHRVEVSPDISTIFTEIRNWESSKGNYTNLIYRVHFSEIPLSIVPFYLGTGKNVGLLVVITLDDSGTPLLYTTVNTCGCYLSFSPTSYMPETMFPPDWEKEYHYVYGEYLPGYLNFELSPTTPKSTFLLLRSNTHRVKDIWLATSTSLAQYPGRVASLRPMAELDSLSHPSGGTTSFFELTGPRQHYVKNSHKIWERLFISWWALDWRVGEDKRYGNDPTDNTPFYTSLKPWAREESDLRNFARFLKYWGWNF